MHNEGYYLNISCSHSSLMFEVSDWTSFPLCTLIISFSWGTTSPVMRRKYRFCGISQGNFYVSIVSIKGQKFYLTYFFLTISVTDMDCEIVRQSQLMLNLQDQLNFETLKIRSCYLSPRCWFLCFSCFTRCLKSCWMAYTEGVWQLQQLQSTIGPQPTHDPSAKEAILHLTEFFLEIGRRIRLN